MLMNTNLKLVCIFNFRLERTDFMKGYFKLKRIVRRSGDLVNGSINLEAAIWKDKECKLEEILDLVRRIKQLLKKLDETWENNAKKTKKRTPHKK